MTGIDVLSFAERLATDADADADADAPTLEETLELCASDAQEKKLVGALLATKVLARVAERQRASTCDAIAKALGAKFLNALLKPAAADADAESRLDATMRTSLGLSVCSALCQSDAFASSKTMAFWVPTFEKCAGRVARSGFEDLCDEAAADALECAFAHVIAKSKLAEAASAGEGEAVEVRLRVPEGTVLAAKEALREGKLCKLSAVAMDVFDYSMCSEFLNEQSVDSVEIVSSLEILPQICKIMREAAGSELQLRAMTVLHHLYTFFLPLPPEAPRRDVFQSGIERANQDILEAMWVVLNSRTPRLMRFYALDITALASNVVNTKKGAPNADNFLPWLLAIDAQPPPVVLAGAVSAGATKKVPSLLALIVELVRVEISVALHGLSDATKGVDVMAELGFGSAMRLYSEIMITISVIVSQVLSEDGEITERGKTLLKDEMGRLSIQELMRIEATNRDIVNTMLEAFEDTETREIFSVETRQGLMQAIMFNWAESPSTWQSRFARLMPYWFGEMLELDARRVESPLELDAIKMSRTIGFIHGFMSIIEDVEGVELLIESKFLSMFSDVYVAHASKRIDAAESYETSVYLSTCLRAITESIDTLAKATSSADSPIHALRASFIESMELMHKRVRDSYLERLPESMREKSNVDEYVVGENGERFSVAEKAYAEEVHAVLKKRGVFAGDDAHLDSVTRGFEKL